MNEHNYHVKNIYLVICLLFTWTISAAQADDICCSFCAKGLLQKDFKLEVQKAYSNLS